MTLVRYQDSASRTLVLDFIQLAMTKYPLVTAKAVHAAILDVSWNLKEQRLEVIVIFFSKVASSWRSTAASKALAKPCLAGLAWSCSTITKETLEEEGKKIVDVSYLKV